MKRTLLGSSTRVTSFVCLLGLALAVSTTKAQVSYTSGSYTQTFDSLPATGSSIAWTNNSTLPGWYAWQVTLASAPSTLILDNGSSTSVSVMHNFGATSSADRALGTLPGSTPGDSLTGVRIRNNSSKTYTSFTFSFDGEQWRAASASNRALTTAWTIGSPTNLGDANAGWKTVGYAQFISRVLNANGVALDGNAEANRLAKITGTVAGIQWTPGSDLWIRFTDAYESGGNMGLAIDNFTFSASTDPLVGFRGECIDTINYVNNELVTPNSNMTVRALPLAAYISLVLNYPDAQTAESNAVKYLNAMFTKQDTNTGSETFGHFTWRYNQPLPGDLNATEFCLRPLSVLLHRYAARLGTPYVNSIRPKVLNALTASRNRVVGPDYTNIYSMRTLNWIMLGEALPDAASLSDGKAALGKWLDDIAKEGMHEYDSPTYSVVTYSNLLIGAHNVTDTVAADKFRSVATFLATDLMANHFDGQRRLSGSHSRDYEFITGDDAVNQFYYLEGLRASSPRFYVQNEGTFLYLDRLENGGGLPADVLAWTSKWSQIVIKSLWGLVTSVGQDRYNYITSDFSIGSSGTSYSSPQDKAVTADLASDNSLAQITLVYDPYDAPYGQVKTVNANGISKPNHLKFSAANVQEKGTVLSLADLSPNFAPDPDFLGPYTSVSTAFVFPTQVDALYIDGVDKPFGAGDVFPATSGTVVAVRVGNAVVAARFLVVDGMNGYKPTFAVKLDGPTGRNVGRFVAYHYQNSDSSHKFTSSDKTRVAVVISARTCTGTAEIKTFLDGIKNASPTVANGTTWSVSIPVGGVTLKAAQDTTNNKIVERTVNGKGYVPAALSFNDGGSTTRDIFTERFDSMIKSGWVRCDIGGVATASTASYDESVKTTTVKGSGVDFWNASDSGAFVYRTVTGDCDLIARVDSQSNSNGWAKAGLMIRETLDPNSKCALTYLTPGNGARFSYRATIGGTSSRTGLTGVTAPYWVRIRRVGDSISGYVRSTKDGTWVQMGSTQTIPMNDTVYIGLPVSSCNNTLPSEVVFSNVTVQ